MPKKLRKSKQKSFNEELDDSDSEYSPEYEPSGTRVVKPSHLVELMDKDEVNSLVKESQISKATEAVAPKPVDSYPTYSFEEVAALMACNYHPSMFKRKRGRAANSETE